MSEGIKYPSEAKYCTSRSVVQWEVIRIRLPVTGVPVLRFKVTYSSGRVSVLRPSFPSRAALDHYISRWFPGFPEKEKPMHVSGAEFPAIA